MRKKLAPKLFIGMPVYNGERFITDAIESLMGQDFTDWELLVSDNCSIDRTGEIVKELAARDTRIRYFRQPENQGPYPNFMHVLDEAASPYFMWAAADDVWAPQFVSSCIERLDANQKLGMAFSGLQNIDSFGRPIREYPDLPRFSGKADFATVYRYLTSPEIMGKANLIYSIFRTDVCRAAVKRCPFGTVWGADMNFNLAAITLGGVDIDPTVLFQKRWPRDEDVPHKVDLVQISDQLLHQSCPLPEFTSYMEHALSSVRGTRFWPLAYWVMNRRYARLRKLDKRARGG